MLFPEFRHGAPRMNSIIALALLALAPLGAMAATTLTPGPIVNMSLTTENQFNSCVAIDPTNPQNVVALMDLSGFNTGLLLSVSNDGGATWFSNVASNNLVYAAVAWDNLGNLFVAALDGTTGTDISVFTSADAGQTFTGLITYAGAPSALGAPKLAVGPDPTGVSSVWLAFEVAGGPVNVATAQVTALGVVGAFSATAVAIQNSGGMFPEDITVGPNGEVLVALVSTAQAQGPSQILSSVDLDGLGVGAFSIPQAVTTTNVGSADTIPPQPNFGIRPRCMVGWDRSTSAFTGRVYMVYTSEVPDEGTGNTDIQFIYSDDSAQTWSTPSVLNDDGSTLSQFLPSLAIDQTTGNVAIAFYDARNDTGTGGAGDTDGVRNTDVGYFVLVSDNGGINFTPNLQLNAGPTNAAVASSLSLAFDLGFYGGLAFESGTLIATWSDNSNSTNDNVDGTVPFLEVYTAPVTVVTQPVINPNPTTKPDLVVTAIALVSPTLPVAGKAFTVRATIENQGPSDAGPFYVSAFSDPVFAGFLDKTQSDFTIPDPSTPKKVDVVSVPGLVNGTSVDVVLTMIYNLPGTFTIAVLADSQRNIDEISKLNNELDQVIHVVAPTVDVAVTSMLTTNTVPGKNATFDVTIQNHGNQASGPFTVGFYANRAEAPTPADAPDSTQAVPTIAPNGSIVLTFTLPTQNLPRGGRAWVLADNGNAVVELVESNNVGSAVWGVPNNAPAILSSVTAFSPTPVAGDTVTFTVVAGDPNGDPLTYVWNFGDGTPPTPAGPTVLHVYSAPGVANVSVTVSDGPFGTVVSALTLHVLDNNVVDLGFVISKAGYIKLAVPLPLGLTKRDRAKGKIVLGTPGDHVTFRNQRLTGSPGQAGTYFFTVEYLAPRTKKLIQVRYKYTVLQ